MILETERLILRPWEEADAESLYEYAKDDRVGPAAGWLPHTSAENSREVIKAVLSAPETYAVCRKEDHIAVGSIGLMIGKESNLDLPENEGEIGYWIGVPFWGQGLIPEATRELIRHAFADLHLETLWCGYFDGNEKSKRCQEKCGFTYHHTKKNIHWRLTGDILTEHITRLTKEEWEADAEQTANRLRSASMTRKQPKDLVLYIHGKGGSASEAAHFVPLFPDSEVIGFDYRSQTPWEAATEFSKYYDTVSQGFDSISLIANSIGAYFSLCALAGKAIEKAFLISPIVDMEQLISDMMLWTDVTEEELEKKREIPTSFGETLSWEYLKWVREHPVFWKTPTEILYGEKDDMQSLETLRGFAEKSGANVTVMPNGAHWFRTGEQMCFLDDWLKTKRRK